MRDSMYSNLIIPAATDSPQVQGCCAGDSQTGASAASSPQEYATDSLARAAAGVVSPAAAAGPRCRTNWWVVIAAAALAYAVAKS